MRIYRYHYFRYPELHLLEDDNERRAVLKEAYARFTTWRSPWFLIFGLSAGAIAGGLITVSYGLFPDSLLLRLMSYFVVSVVVGPVMGWSCEFILRTPMRRLLRHILRTRGVPVCLSCGYSLKGNTSGVCPECGTSAGTQQPQ